MDKLYMYFCIPTLCMATGQYTEAYSLHPTLATMPELRQFAERYNGQIRILFKGDECSLDAPDPGPLQGKEVYIAYYSYWQQDYRRTLMLERHSTWSEAQASLQKARNYPGFAEPQIFVGTPISNEEIYKEK